MSIPLHILILEDRQSDAELALLALRQAGFDPSWRRVETEQDYTACLDPALDLILADYTLPQFDALSALRLLRERELDIPFIIVSGSISEDIAVMAIQLGATDYLIKDRMTRLGAAVTRALEQRRLRGAKQDTDQLLRNSEQRFRALIEHSTDGIGLVSSDGTIRYTSPSTSRILGYADEELVGQRAFELIHPDDHASIQARLAEGLQQPGQSVIAECRVRHKDGAWGLIEIVANNLLAEPSVRAIVLNYRDITERRQAAAQLLQAQKMEIVGRLAGGVAHDFNNLLTAISGYAELVLAEAPPDTVVRDDLKEILKAAGRAATLTRQLLAFARKQIIEPQVLNLNDMIGNIDNLLRRLIGEDIDLVTLPSPDLGQVRADPGQIEQVLVNLAVNARDAMPGGGKLTIETRNAVLDDDYAQQHLGVTPGAYVLVAITDTGVGMDSETQRRIFEPFFTTKEPGRGTGLGMATCYGIVEQHGGHVWVYSELHHGTTFKIYLPRVEAPAEVWPQRADASDLPHGTETVLLAEDDPAVHALVARVLRDQGYTVLEAADGAAAVQVAREQTGATIHLLLTDVVMPHISGKALAEQISNMYPGIKTLFISGYANDAIVHHGRLDPGVAFLNKPFSPSALARKVREVLDA
jgi:two-component system, cell cycle sensor histidine kinase and response regulator CckA